MSGAAFPRARWIAAAWLAVWVPAYAWAYPLANFLNLCDLAVLLTCVGLWRGHALLLSSQAVSSLIVDSLWAADAAGRLLVGRHLVGGTEYMWDPAIPAFVRLLSLFHVAWPPLLLWSLRRVGYDRRGLALQAAIAAVVLIASHGVDPPANLNFAHEAPFVRRPLGPAPVHLGVTLVTLVAAIYGPTHWALARIFPSPKDAGGAPR